MRRNGPTKPNLRQTKVVSQGKKTVEEERKREKSTKNKIGDERNKFSRATDFGISCSNNSAGLAYDQEKQKEEYIIRPKKPLMHSFGFRSLIYSLLNVKNTI